MQLRDAVTFFSSLFQTIILGFTPLAPLQGPTRSVTEIDLRLGVHALAWVFKRHHKELGHAVQGLNVIEVGACKLYKFADSEVFKPRNPCQRPEC